jgi:hypothetical protein
MCFAMLVRSYNMQYIEDNFVTSPKYKTLEFDNVIYDSIPFTELEFPNINILIVRISVSNGLYNPSYCSETCFADIFWNNQLNIANLISDSSNINLIRNESLITSITISSPNVGCDPFTWAYAALNRVNNPIRYYFKLFVLPREVNCNWEGMATVGCYNGNCYAFVRSKEPLVIAHELGHNLGLHHASTDLNNDGIIDNEYGDFSSVMSNSLNWKRFNTINQWIMNGIKYQNAIRIDIPNIADSKSYVLSTSSLNYPRNTDIVQLLIVSDPITENRYWVSLRTSVTLPSYDAMLDRRFINKISIHRWTGQQTILLGLLDIGQSFLNGKILFYGFIDQNSVRVVISGSIIQPPTTASRTQSLTPSRTISKSRSISVTKSITPSKTINYTTTSSKTKSVSKTKPNNYTATSSKSANASLSNSLTKSITSSKTKFFTFSNTRSSSSSKTNFFSFSNTRSSSPSKTKFFSFSNTRSSSPSKTKFFTFSNTRSSSSSKTKFFSFSNTRSSSPSKTKFFTFSNTRSSSPSKTKFFTFSNTRSSSPSNVISSSSSK